MKMFYYNKYKLIVLLVASFLLLNGSCKKSQTNSIPRDPNPIGGSPDVLSWITKGDKSQLLQKQTTILSFGSIANTSPNIDVNDNVIYQDIDGFGYTLTGGSAYLINGLAPNVKNNLLRELFSNDDNALKISFLRISIGASDLVATPYTYNDLPNGQTDINQQNFSIAADMMNVIQLLKDILVINPNIKILATSWTAPAWMKTNNSLKGGSLSTTYYASYANYFVKYIKAMQAQNIPIYAVTPQNEPLNGNNNPSMMMTDTAQASFIKNHLGPAFVNNGINTKIICYDHNCDHPEYAINILNDAMTKPFVYGSAFHLYAGDISTLSTVRNAHPDKAIFFTEQYTSSTGDFGSDLKWHLKNVIIGSMRNWSRTALEWNLAADANSGPFTPGGCFNCKGALTIGSNISKNVSYYIIAHASAFVPPNSSVIQSNNIGKIYTVAFKTPTGGKVLIVLNDDDTDAVFNIKFLNRWANVTLPANAVGTYTWQ